MEGEERPGEGEGEGGEGDEGAVIDPKSFPKLDRGSATGRPKQGYSMFKA